MQVDENHGDACGNGTTMTRKKKKTDTRSVWKCVVEARILYPAFVLGQTNWRNTMTKSMLGNVDIKWMIRIVESFLSTIDGTLTESNVSACFILVSDAPCKPKTLDLRVLSDPEKEKLIN